VLGFNRDSDEALFRSTPHIRIYVDDKISEPLLNDTANNSITVISNPKIVNESKKLLNPNRILSEVKSHTLHYGWILDKKKEKG